MPRRILKLSILAVCFSFVSFAATAQQVIHAMGGTVRFIDKISKTITIDSDEGSTIIFADQTNSKTFAESGKMIGISSTAVDSSKQERAFAIVYYVGDNEDRKAVALRSLGPGPFTKVSGTVVKVENKEHWFSVKDDAGTAAGSFKIESDTVAETGFGAVEGYKYQPKKGDHVRVVANPVNGIATALFINSM